MATFTDAVYDVTKMGTPTLLIYSLSGTNNVIVLNTVGTLNGFNVKGILYNAADFTATPAATTTVTLSSPGDTSTVVILSGVGPLGATLSLINTENFSTSVTVLSSSTTVIARVSAGGYNDIGPDKRRRWNLNG